MSQENGIEVRRTGAATERAEWRQLTKREIDSRLEAICAEVTRAFGGVEPERIEYLGETIEALPVDTRLFVRIMGRYVSFN